MLKLTDPRRASALLIGPLLLIATACGGSTDSDQRADEGVASLSDDASDGAAPVDGASDEAVVDETEAPENPEDAMALFNECMEEHGLGGAITVIGGPGGDSGAVQIEDLEVVEVDPQAGGGSFEDFDMEAFDEANKACEGHLANLDGGFDLTPEQEAAMEDAQLKFADCMAEQGIEMPDFDSSGGFTITAEVDASEIDPQSGGLSPEDLGFDFEAFDEAASACDSVFEQFETAQP